MKNLKYIVLCCVLALGMTSCNDWLDVNTDPDNPNNESASLANRLPWIQHFYMYSAGATNMRTACQAGVYYSNNGNNSALNVTWACVSGSVTASYQTFFTVVANNLADMYKKGQTEGAYHYMAAANVFHVMGFMQMLDLYGEMPYTDALGLNPSPTYDDGKTIYNGCIAKLDEAIELLGKSQDASAEKLESGDIWNGGDVNKWLKLCYGLKARYLLKLSKKTDLYNADAILDCLSKAPQSNADNTLAVCYNSASDIEEPYYGDATMTNGNWDYVAYGSNQRISQYYYNLLTNMRGASVVDPRMSKIVPASMCNIKLDASGKVRTYDWLRSKGVDIYGDATRLRAGGATSIQIANWADADTKINYTIENADDRMAFIAALKGKHAYTVDGSKVSVTYAKGAVFVNSSNYAYAGDTIYVNIRSNGMMTGNADLGEMNMNWYFTMPAKSAGAVGSTGSFQVRPISDQEILTYHEICFIKAEVYMRKGDKPNALIAYKAGIEAHMKMMQNKLTEWKAAGYDNPDMWPMNESEMASYLASKAVCQDASSLTMTDIMLQKYLAMGCSIENWNDMRRFNYSAGNVGDFGIVYPGYGRSPLFAGQSQITGTTKTDPNYWMRRWMLPGSLELNYNSANALAVNARAGDPNIWCIPIWWDCATDDEYYGYIK